MADDFYTVGGAVQAGKGQAYLSRAADSELLRLCRAGEFVFILSPRQMGKSSLMYRTAAVLAGEDIQSAIVDLELIGVNSSAEQWYFGVLSEIAAAVGVGQILAAWWDEHRNVSFPHRFALFIENIMLAEVRDRVVFFIDEIDTTIGLPFADDFFTCIRGLYHRRATNVNLRRL